MVVVDKVMEEVSEKGDIVLDSEFQKQGNFDGHHVVVVPFLENVVANDASVVSVKKRGRPKGSKYIRTSVQGNGGVSGTVSVMDGSGQRVLMKKKKRLGRLKGSKNKERSCEENVGISGVVSRMDGSGEGDLMKKKRVGRPKGSKNKKRKVEENEEFPSAVGLVNGSDEMLMKKKKRLGRPKGSKNKKRNTDLIVEKEMSKTDIVAAGDFRINTNQVSGNNETFKKKMGRPKGSKNKNKVLIGRLTAPHCSGAGNKNIDSNKGKIFMSEENAGELNEFIVSYKKRMIKRVRPKGSKTKKEVTLGYLSNANATSGHEVDVICQGENEKRITMAGQNGVFLSDEEGMIVKKDRRGRSRGSKTKGKVIPGHSIGNGERIFKKGRRGRPKGSKNKKKVTAGNLVDANLNNRGQDVGTMRINVAEKGMLLTEEDKGDLNEVSLVSAVKVVRRKGVLGRPKGSKNKKRTIISSSSDVYSAHGLGVMSISKEHENNMASLATDHMVGILSEAIAKKDSCSLPQGLHNENKIVGSGEDQHAFVDAAEDGTRRTVKKTECRGRVTNSENKKQAAVRIEVDQDLKANTAILSPCENGVTKLQGRRGRPKGLKNKKEIVFDAVEIQRMAGEIATDTSGVNLSMKRKNGCGRPEGSKNKNANIKSEENNKAAGKLIVHDDRGGSQAERKAKYCGMLPAATENGRVSGESVSLDALGGSVNKRRVNRGRPKGSKNKKKTAPFNLGFPCQVSCQNAVSRMVKRRGRPKGLNDKKKIVIVSECMGEQELSANAETSGLTFQGISENVTYTLKHKMIVLLERGFKCH